MSYFYVLVLFGIIILVHELGHFMAALAIGVQVQTFSIGFGPRLFGMRFGGTDFRLSAIPFGGYVQTHILSLQSKPKWQRAVVIVGGPLLNIVLAIGIVAGIYMYAYPKPMGTTNPVIASIKAGSAAAQAGLQSGDRIVEFDGKREPNWEFILMQEALNANYPINGIVERQRQLVRFTVIPRMDAKHCIGVAGWVAEQNIRVGEVEQGSPASRAGLRRGDLFVTANGQRLASPVMIQQAVFHSGGNPVDFQVLRNGRLESITITPSLTNKPGTPWRIGISFSVPFQLVKLGLGGALKESVQLNRQNALMVLGVLEGIVEGRVSPKLISGPIGMAQMSSKAAQAGVESCLFLMASLSLQVAIFNLLPIPILDGGALLILIIEILTHGDISLQIKEVVFKLAFVFLMMIMVFSIYNDVTRLVAATVGRSLC